MRQFGSTQFIPCIREFGRVHFYYEVGKEVAGIHFE